MSLIKYTKTYMGHTGFDATLHAAKVVLFDEEMCAATLWPLLNPWQQSALLGCLEYATSQVAVTGLEMETIAFNPDFEDHIFRRLGRHLGNWLVGELKSVAG